MVDVFWVVVLYKLCFVMQQVIIDRLACITSHDSFIVESTRTRGVSGFLCYHMFVNSRSERERVCG